MVYTPYVWHDGDTGGTLVTATRLNALEQGVAGAYTTAPASSVTFLAGTGIDPTGATPSTAAVQALLTAVTAGTTVIIPDAAIINLDGPITVSKRIRLTGSGELRWTAGVVGAAALTITAAGTHLDAVRLNNSPGTANQTGSKQYGIAITANGVRITNCTTLQFQQAIAVMPNGEWHDFTITGNHVLDVPGSGDGSGSTSSNGEDRGDGIVSWGAAGSIVGNRVTARAGTDARIGIHAEGLPGSETASPPYPHSDALVAITGNVVTGQFRRSIVSETVTRTVITGNAVADATWWGIALIGGSSRSLVANNSIKWTRTATDTQGAAWTPSRSGIMLYNTTAHARVTGNIIYADTGATMPNGITAQASGSGTGLPSKVSIIGNTIDAADGNINVGVSIPVGGTSVEVAGNRIQGVTVSGVSAAAGVTDFTATGNTVSGTFGTTQYGIRAEGTAANARADGNTITGCTTGIALRNRTGYVTVIGNLVATATTGVDLFQSAGKATVNSNTFATVTTATVNLPTGTVTIGNN